MNTILFVTFLLSGYIFVSSSRQERYTYKRVSGWDAYLYPAIWGVFSTICAVIIFGILNSKGTFSALYRFALWTEIIDNNTISKMLPWISNYSLRNEILFGIFCILTIPIAWLAACVKNHLTLGLSKKQLTVTVLKQTEKMVRDNPFESFLFAAVVERFYVKVILECRKFYIGLMSYQEFKDGELKYLEILPISSGYIDKESSQIHFTTHYYYIYRELEDGKWLNHNQLTPYDFKIIFPVENIIRISRFDYEIYDKFCDMEREKSASKITE